MIKKFIVVLIILSYKMSFSQKNEAIVKYQDAEIAYSNKDFKMAIDKLQEAENLLGIANPKITYLRILTYSELAFIDNTYIVKTEQEIENYLIQSKKYAVDEEKIKEVVVLKTSLRKNILNEIAAKEEQLKQALNDRVKLEAKEKEASQLFNSFSLIFNGLEIGNSGLAMASWLKENKRKISGHHRHLAAMIKMVSDKDVLIETHMKQSEYTGGFFYSKDKSKVAGVFLCPIYTDNSNALEDQYQIQKQTLINHFGVSNISEVSQITSTDVMFKCTKWNDNSKGLVCTGIMYGTYYSWVFIIKIDYNQLND